MSCLVSHPVSQSLAMIGFCRPAEKVSGSEIRYKNTKLSLDEAHRRGLEPYKVCGPAE